MNASASRFDDLLAFLQDEVNEDLRAVDYYDRDGYENLAIRGDVAARYTDRASSGCGPSGC